MPVNFVADPNQSNRPSYTYPEFVIDEQSGQVKVNLIDKASGRVVRHIPPTELNNIVKGSGGLSLEK